MDIEQFRRAGYKAIDDICDHYLSLHDKPVTANVQPGYLKNLLPKEAPQSGEPIEEITQDYHKLVLPGVMQWQHPRFFAYFPSATSYEAILGDMYAHAIGPNPAFNWAISPGCTELEEVVMDWAAKLLGIGPAFHNASDVGGGVVQGTSTEAAIIAAIAARSRYLRQHPDVHPDKLLLYATSETHSFSDKVGLALNLKLRRIVVTATGNFALGGALLRRAMEEDTRAGLHPFMFIATVGTFSSGAVDHLGEIGEIVASVPSMWLHVDSAWAGMAMACPEYRDLCLVNEVNKYADSYCISLHKWGLVNVDCATLWVRNRKNLIDALSVTSKYLQSPYGASVIDYRNWHLGFGRPFRALKLWFVLRSFGVHGIQQYIRQTIQRAELFVSLIKQSTLLRLVAPPFLALSVFRLEPPNMPLSLDELNALNKVFSSRLSARHDVAFTSTELNGTVCIRCSIGVQRTEEAHVREGYGVLCTEAEEALKEWEAQRK